MGVFPFRRGLAELLNHGFYLFWLLTGPPAVQSDCRPTTTPGGLLEHHSFYSYFLFLFFIFISVFSLNLFKYYSSICLIDQYCVLVVDGRPPRPGRRQGSPSRPRTRQSRPSSSSPRLGRTGRLELVVTNDEKDRHK